MQLNLQLRVNRYKKTPGNLTWITLNLSLDKVSCDMPLSVFLEYKRD